MTRNFIPDKEYNRIKKILPIATVDLIIKTDKGVLLGVRKRKGEPMMGERSLIGGRILYKERIEDAIKRKARTETGLIVKPIRLVGVYTIFSASRGVERRYNISLVYLVKKVGGKLRLTDEYSEYAFIKRLDSKLHPSVVIPLRDSGVFGGSRKRVLFKDDYLVT
jgi:colanic acid biosynthesis protein WcaH